MTSTSKNGMVVTSSIRVVPRTMIATQAERDVARQLSEPMRTEEVTWGNVFKVGTAFALIVGGGLFVLWVLMKLTLHWMGK